MVWRFSRDLYDRRGFSGRDPLVGQTSEDAGAAPDVLAHPGAHDSAVWEPHGLGLGPSQPEATLQAASRIAEAELLAALVGLDDPIAWICENYPVVMREMPQAYLSKLEVATHTLAGYFAEAAYPHAPLASRKAPHG